MLHSKVGEHLNTKDGSYGNDDCMCALTPAGPYYERGNEEVKLGAKEWKSEERRWWYEYKWKHCCLIQIAKLLHGE